MASRFGITRTRIASATFPSTTRAISALAASLALRCRLIQTTRDPGAGAEPNSNAAFILFRSEPRYELLYWFPDCYRCGSDGYWRRQLHRSRARLDRRADRRRSGRNGVRVRGSSAADRRAVLPRRKKLSCALSVASSAWSNSRPPARHICAQAAWKSGRKSSCRHSARNPTRSIFKCDVRSARAESGFRSEEFPLVALARPPHRRRIRILIRRGWRARERSALKLLGDDHSRGGWHRPKFWPGAGCNRGSISLEVWRDQLPRSPPAP